VVMGRLWFGVCRRGSEECHLVINKAAVQKLTVHVLPQLIPS